MRAPGARWNFNGYNFDVLVRRGILAELDGDFALAARCYGGVSTSAAVQEREYECIRRAAAVMPCESGKTRDFRNETAETRDPQDENGNLPFHITAALLRSRENPIKKPKRKTVRAHRTQMEEYRLRAEAGDTASMGALAMAYHLGYPVKRDDAQAFLWTSRAADEGDAEAMYQAAYFFENGFGTPRDTDAALLLYTESAKAGVRAAAIRLYEIYTLGIPGVSPDGKKAAHFLFMSGEADGEDE